MCGCTFPFHANPQSDGMAVFEACVEELNELTVVVCRAELHPMAAVGLSTSQHGGAGAASAPSHSIATALRRVNDQRHARRRTTTCKQRRRVPTVDERAVAPTGTQSLRGTRSLAPQSRPPDGAAVGGGERGDDGWRCRCALANGQRHRRPRVHDPSRRAGCAQLPRRPPPAHPRTSVRLQLHKKTRSPAVPYDLRPTPSPAACLSLRRRGQLWATAWLCITVTIIVESDCITRGFSRRLQLSHLPLSLELDGFPVDLDLEDLGRGLGARHGHTCWGGFRGRHRGLLRDAAGTEALLDCDVDEA